MECVYVSASIPIIVSESYAGHFLISAHFIYVPNWEVNFKIWS